MGTPVHYRPLLSAYVSAVLPVLCDRFLVFAKPVHGEGACYLPAPAVSMYKHADLHVSHDWVFGVHDPCVRQVGLYSTASVLS